MAMEFVSYKPFRVSVRVDLQARRNAFIERGEFLPSQVTLDVPVTMLDSRERKLLLEAVEVLEGGIVKLVVPDNGQHYYLSDFALHSIPKNPKDWALLIARLNDAKLERIAEQNKAREERAAAQELEKKRREGVALAKKVAEGRKPSTLWGRLVAGLRFGKN